MFKLEKDHKTRKYCNIPGFLLAHTVTPSPLVHSWSLSVSDSHRTRKESCILLMLVKMEIIVSFSVFPGRAVTLLTGRGTKSIMTTKSIIPTHHKPAYMSHDSFLTKYKGLRLFSWKFW